MTTEGRRFRAVFAEVAWREDMRRYRSSPAVAELRRPEAPGVSQ